MCSTKFIRLISEYTLPKRQVFETKVYQEDKALPYFFVYFYEVRNDLIDFQRTGFGISDYVYPVEHTLNFSDLNELESYDAKLPEGKKVAIANNIMYLQKDIKVDLFRIFSIHNDIFISDRLAKALKESGMTGFRLLEYNSDTRRMI